MVILPFHTIYSLSNSSYPHKYCRDQNGFHSASTSRIARHQTRSLFIILFLGAMEDQCGGNGKHMNTNTNSNGYVDTSKAERAVWLMKCPPLVSRSLRAPPSDPSRPVAKVVVSIDPLNSNDDDSPPQVLTLFANNIQHNHNNNNIKNV